MARMPSKRQQGSFWFGGKEMLNVKSVCGIFAAAVMVLLVSACGGGGSDDAQAADDAPRSGGGSIDTPADGASGFGAEPTAGTDTVSGTIGVPAAFEAEDFDRGGEGLGYHDSALGNAGGQYRPNEDVDIIATADSTGGNYDVYDFETGEWLAYTINVADTADYDLALRAASESSDSAFHIEVDGADVSGRVTVPSTGGSGYQWVSAPRVSLTAGQHLLRIVADQQYFNLNAIRVVPPPSSEPTRLFASGFEGAVTLAPKVLYLTGAWQDIFGTDSETGFTWPPQLWGGITSRFQLIAGNSELIDALTLNGYAYNELQSVTGHDGGTTRALYSSVQQSVGGALVNWDSTQNDLGIFPGPSGQSLPAYQWVDDLEIWDGFPASASPH